MRWPLRVLRSHVPRDMNTPQAISPLTAGRLLARNTVWNLLGQLLPMLVAIVTVPLLIRNLGDARFGVLSLAWVLIGYFSLFDLGLGRALTVMVADRLARHQREHIPPVVWTSLLLMLALGVVGGLLTAAASSWLIHRALKIPPALQPETLLSFYLLAISIPLVTLTSGLRGVLEGLQRFRILNLIRIPITVFSLAGPLLVLPFSHSLVMIVALLMAARLVGLAMHWMACIHALPELRAGLRWQRSLLKPVARLGSWMTVSNVIGPVLIYTDRFLIGGLLSVSAVTYYAAPFDMVTRLSVIPGAVAGVLFPALAVSMSQDPLRTELLLGRGIKYVFMALFPLIFLMMTFAPEGLRLWLGPAFAAQASSVLRWLAAGVFLNSLAYMPFALIQSAGRPDVTARLHLIELPLYCIALVILVKAWGIEGAAIAWVGRIALDTVLIFFYARRIIGRKLRFWPKLQAATVLGLLFFAAACLPETWGMKTVVLISGLALFALAAGRWAVAPDEWAFLLRKRGIANLAGRADAAP